MILCYWWFSMNDISKEKIEEGLRAVANNKDPGLDFIPAELIKWGGNTMVDKLTNISTIVWHTVKAPDEWKCGAIVKLQKKGDLCDWDHWWNVTLLTIARKILCWVLLKWFQKHIDTKLREEQAGFTQERFCNEQIFTLSNIIEQSLEYRKSLIANYVDFKRFFDRTYRPILWEVLKI